MAKKAVEIKDLTQLVSVTDPQISPDGKRVVFVHTKIDEEENTYRAHLYHIDLETGQQAQWTHGKERVSSPRWSADGTAVAFLSDRDEKNQLFVMSAAGGEARSLTDFEKGVNGFEWSPCGTKIWFNALAKEGKTFTDKEEKEEKKQPEPYHVDKMKYKMDGMGLLPKDFHRHIGSVEIDSKNVEQLTEGSYHHSLEAVSHDGKKLIYGVTREENLDFVFRQPLYLYDLETAKESALIEEEGYFGDAAFSFDDSKVAFVGSMRQYENATHTEIYVADLNNQTRICLTEGLDAPVGDYVVADHQQGAASPGVVWTKDDHLYFQVSAMGDVRLYFASLDGMIFPASPDLEHVYGYDVSQDGEFAIAAISNPVNPGELYRLTIATGERKTLTRFNQEFLEGTELAEAQPIVAKGAKDWAVHGWLMKPYGYQEGQKYPLVVNIHGGPHAMYANTFVHEMQLLAARGFGVLYVNPRGSHGYSQKFVDAVRGEYGGGDYEDIMNSVTETVESNDWIDADRLGVTGGSYGGFMTNWIVGHSDLFKAAVTQRSISNWISFFGVSDIGYYFSDWQIGADMTDVDKLWEHSPLKYAKNVETPLLILHSENDYRCPIEQSEQLYVTLKSMGKETEFVRFPEADHNLSRTGKPNLRFARLEQITGWMEKYL
ncbi:dipeptidyl aminopeptidase/acylaminoacyl peptidase [Planomicrobium stackebrandtii]|uniref:Dipeptidyl aminopeptidase/acylaminoacyl peptidase n=1 Tax=Planomicrobium stackebrandtii TaxID=253160 RepID=A0ABU0H0C6_9BACL|nr:S9 family peptidase [Planomicrobium stackebrandtii]MDQ0430255.1 dipeptidyl aminopeptidase/acylaminoacyl peptidase [Planomicrobium stackebrandtii]